MRLLILRHAKADRAAGKHMDDHERALTARGRGAAARMGGYMKAKHYVPQRVLCSSAVRTRETLDVLLPYFITRAQIAFARGLYLADWGALLKQVQAMPADCESLLLVGHNPGLERLAIALALHPSGIAERSRAEKLAQKFPTAALAVLDADGPGWSAFKPGSARLIDVVRPRDLDPDEDEE